MHFQDIVIPKNSRFTSEIIEMDSTVFQVFTFIKLYVNHIFGNTDVFNTLSITLIFLKLSPVTIHLKLLYPIMSNISFIFTLTN